MMLPRCLLWMLLMGVGVGVARADVLSFNAALSLAEQNAPDLSAKGDGVEAARESSIAAGVLPNPKLVVGLENFPINGPEALSSQVDPMTSRAIGIEQEVPNAAKRQAQKAVAAAEVSTAQGERHITQLEVRRDTAINWINRYYIEQKLALFPALEQQNQVLLAAVRAQVLSGRANPADLITPKLAQAQLQDRRDDLERDLQQAKIALRRWLGTAADSPLAGTPPVYASSSDTLHQHLHQHPELALYDALTRKAQAEIASAEANKKSDWGVAVVYQKRAPVYGDMVSLEFSMALPGFHSTEEDAQIAAQRANLNELSAQREMLTRDHASEMDQEFAAEEALARQMTRLDDTSLPLLAQQYNLELSSYRAGKTELSEVIGAHQAWLEEQMKAIDLHNQHDQLAAKLQLAYGEQ